MSWVTAQSWSNHSPVQDTQLGYQWSNVFSPPKSVKECSSQLSGWISSWSGRSWTPDKLWIHASLAWPSPQRTLAWLQVLSQTQVVAYECTETAPAWALCKETHPKKTSALWYILYYVIFQDIQSQTLSTLASWITQFTTIK